MAKNEIVIKRLNPKGAETKYVGHEPEWKFQPTEDKIMSWDVDGAERRMDVIGQNGNTGEHYENEIINNPANTNVDKKKRDKRKYYKPKAK